MKRVYRDIAILLAVFAGLWLAFTFIFSTSFHKSESKNSRQEQKLALYLHEHFLEEHDTLQDSRLQLMMDSVNSRLTKAAGKPGGYFKVWLLKGDSRNAFATLNGNIYLFQGMVELAHSPEVLAAVLAHEMGHLVHEDFQSRLTREISMTALLAIFGGGNTETISELGKTVLGLQYDRQQETEADAYASELLQKASINPDRLTQLFLKLQRAENSHTPEAFNFLLTHPHLSHRIEQAAMHTADSSFIEKPFAFDWQE
ncbi:peptidase m48 ste24p [Flammeovirgaceae bacterium 311]|nr:peptidase m48 ste24p [Flammeovirgaceae bacterium 311]